MNTNIITMTELAHSKNANGWFSDSLTAAANTLEIANKAIAVLSDGSCRKAGEIAEAITLTDTADLGYGAEVSAQRMGTILRKLETLGRIKREEVVGEPIEVTVPALEYEKYDYKRHKYIAPHPAYTKTITPKINYYSLA